MLKQRILTACILLPLFLGLLIYLPPTGFCIFTAIIMLIAGWEWSFLMGVKRFPYTLIYPTILGGILWVSLWLQIPDVLLTTFFRWLFAAILVIVYPKLSQAWGRSVVVRALMGFFVLVPCWIAINFIRSSSHGLYILLLLFVLIWGADTSAYFVGKKWGKTKLAPEVSPGKSWQGFLGALVATVILSIILLISLHVPYHAWGWTVLLFVTTVVFSVLGDLFESMLKRKEGLKDSSHLLPGHGGILDRIDSLTAAAPIFVLGAMWLSKVIH